MNVLPWWRDSDVREYGAPKRIHVTGSLGLLMIGVRSQMWWPLIGTTDVWFWVSYWPPREWRDRFVLPSHRGRMTRIPLLGMF